MTNKNLDLSIEGMTCASCVRHVEKALLSVPGVTEATVNLATEKAHVKLNAGTDEKNLFEAVDKAGYTARLTSTPATETQKKN